LNGRRTVWEDPFKAGRNGLTGLAQCMEKHSPLALVILMLGTNDFQFSQPYNNAWSAAQGVAALVREIRTAPIEPGVPVPPVLVICPPLITSPKGILAPKFFDAENKCLGLAAAYAAVCQELDCAMFDAGSVTASSRVDGIHLDSDQHRALGQALVSAVAPILAEDPV
jgi:lysophospholipase L1-like esterase